MKREKRQTKRERKAHNPHHRPGPNVQQQHIHCISCGRHLDPAELTASPATATILTCDHGSRFACCVGCIPDAEKRLAEHDRSGRPVETAGAWH
ncbi:MAG: hypothetical protein R3B13_34870 [Polyangiaceae bacterium]